MRCCRSIATSLALEILAPAEGLLLWLKLFPHRILAHHTWRKRLCFSDSNFDTWDTKWEIGHLKGSCHGQLTFYMWRSSFCWVQRHIFYPNRRFPSPSNLANTENPGTSSALKSGYPEEYCALKIGYPEEHVTLKSGYRKRLLHWKVATGRSCYIENWLPGKETKSISSNVLWERILSSLK